MGVETGGGMSWLLELDAKLDGALQFIRTLDNTDGKLAKLDDALKKTEHATDKAGEGHKRHKKHADGLGGAIESLKHRSHELLEALGIIAAFEIGERLVEGIKEIGAEILHAAAGAERTTISFKALFGAEEGSELVEYIDHIAKTTEFTDDELKSFAHRLGAAGFAAKDMRRALEAVSDIAVFSPNGLEGAQGAVEALARLNTTGQISARTIGALNLGAQALPRFLEEMSKRTGLGVDAIKKKMEGGKLDIAAAKDSLYALIMGRTGKALGGAGADMGGTLGAQLKHLKQLPEQYFEEMANSPGFTKIKEVFGRVLERLDPSKEPGKHIIASLSTAFNRFASFIQTSGVDKYFSILPQKIAKVADVLGTIWEVGAPFVKEVVRKFSVLIEFLGKVGEVIGDVAYGITGVLDWIEATTTKAAQFVDGVVTAITAIGSSIWHGLVDGIKGGISAAVNAVTEIGSLIWHGLVDGIRNGISAAVTAVSDLGSAIVGKLKGLLGIHSPSTVFEDMGAMTAAGYIKGIDGKTRSIDMAVERSFALSAADVSSSPPSLAGPAGATITLNVPITVNVSGGGAPAREQAEQIAARVSDLIPGALESAIEQLRNQVGA